MVRSGCALEGVRLKTPALIRWAHIDRPITPVPIQPTRVFDGLTGSASEVVMVVVVMVRRRWMVVRVTEKK
ncbi:hypothetical protein RJ641_026012 [Dillenia turbinata]|uniref:Uncharacterized protein n=1 Tax=Dillenia turbinata TaxID=194707 RepID=A0AAN8ZTP9_9MAGN